MMDRIKIKNPRSRDLAVSVDVDISIDGAEFIPFTAMPGDAAGSDIYRDALAGTYGGINQAPGEDYYWSGVKWIAPGQDELVSIAEARKVTLMQAANNSIAPLQDAVELDMATDAETLLLERWKKYRVLLNRVDTSTAPDIDWPEQPE